MSDTALLSHASNQVSARVSAPAVLTRRDLLLSAPSALFAPAARRGRKILVTLLDGFGPEYLEQSDMPNLKQMCRAGSFRIGEAVIPSVTNVNNASLVTGCFPEAHGITANFTFNPATREFSLMESSTLLRQPTIFEKARKAGLRSALVCAKDKVRTLCSRGAGVAVSAEKPSADYVQAAGSKPDIYSPEANYWTIRAARHALKTADLVYLSSTDYMMHTYAPDSPKSLQHLHTLDGLLGEIANEYPGLELYLTADHGMNAKPDALDLARVLAANSIRSVTVPVIRDKHKVHHQNLGGSSYVFLEAASDRDKALEILKSTAGVEEVFNRAEAAKLFRLEPGRIGDLVILGNKQTAFGDLADVRERTAVRTHGSRHESRVPILIHGVKADITKYKYNLDLTRILMEEWA